jgi:hypothetical protein
MTMKMKMMKDVDDIDRLQKQRLKKDNTLTTTTLAIEQRRGTRFFGAFARRGTCTLLKMKTFFFCSSFAFLSFFIIPNYFKLFFYVNAPTIASTATTAGYRFCSSLVPC